MLPWALVGRPYPDLSNSKGMGQGMGMGLVGFVSGQPARARRSAYYEATRGPVQDIATFLGTNVGGDRWPGRCIGRSLPKSSTARLGTLEWSPSHD